MRATLSLTAVLLTAAVSAVALAKADQRGPAPEALYLDPTVLAMACAPSVVFERPLADLQVTGGQDSFARRVYSEGDLITINAGTDNGIEVGQQFYTRRTLVDQRRPITRTAPGVVRTTGWIKVYAVDKTMSLATITHGCETVDVGDYLEPFVLPTPPAVEDVRPAQKDNYGRVMIGNDRRRSFGKGDFMVVNRGSDHGVAPGARFVVYRDKLQARNFLFDLGEAVAVDVRTDTSTLLVTVSRDAFRDGDYVALRK